jgi:tetratricopeptide (TPR) repeat protein
MADPQSSSSLPTDPSGSDREDARIEQLLVAGLDQYFAGDFESAINLWTRVLFLDRHHDRARAYIERARSAQAEHHRQTEALVHEGLVAFDRGDVEHARALLSDALDRGASQDLTLGVLDRIERLDVGTSPTPHPHRPSPRPRNVIAGHRPPAESPQVMPAARFWTVTGSSLAILGVASWWLWTSSSWQALWPAQAAAARMSAIPEVNAPLPVPTVAEAYMRRGQDLFESGRLRDALAEFDRVPAGDPLRLSADEMRAHIQRELLSLALTETTTAAPTSDASVPPPE